MPTLRLALILTAALGLTACDGGEEKPRDQRTAAGEILPGSISDAMLPFDTVRSQPPLAPEAEPSGRAKSGGEPKAAASDPEEAPAEAPAEPLETPAPSAPAAE